LGEVQIDVGRFWQRSKRLGRGTGRRKERQHDTAYGENAATVHGGEIDSSDETLYCPSLPFASFTKNATTPSWFVFHFVVRSCGHI
jgi:hypothetical protein